MAAEDIDTAIPIGHDRGAFMAHALPPLSGTRRRVAAPGHAERRVRTPPDRPGAAGLRVGCYGCHG
ncbi:hypothetical protein BDDG_06789 [Blastomyces dermatitidis ATCC 18188]|uniref:Uncharacterized protein n=1 Tax=Ajellomyces dermatitidis (strain ATCC 18188 / CBS 674.68) TaxID=653446 RepID=F2TKT1_AJEDA|nr:hypothetical protein BDDG_06789 [Blastomyces dermatitidis ATCC 18188]EQL28620.1 hypothetical protein BDFG_08675 [Blastomyces dermatitidis ATCC 26199]